MSRTHLVARAATVSFLAALVALVLAPPAAADGSRARKRPRAAALSTGPNAASQDLGDVAVVVDNGLIVTSRNPFDLSPPTTLSFAPVAAGKFAVSRSAARFDADVGPALAFGHPAATLFPGDDDTQEVAFPAGFPYFGTTYTSVWVNTDGNLTFGEPDFRSNPRDKARHALGPPRVSGYLHDWNARNALNPAGNGSIHAAVKANPARLVATWNGVADFEGGESNTFQITLYATGAVELTLVDVEDASSIGVVGIAQGRGQGPFRNVDFSTQPSPQTVDAGAVFEAFAKESSFNEMLVAKEFYKSRPDQFDFLVMFSDFPVNNFWHSVSVKNDTHGIGVALDPATGEPYPGYESSTFDDSALWGSAGELEQIVVMNNVNLLPSNDSQFVNPPIQPYSESVNIIQFYENFGWPVTLDGQPMSQVRIAGTLPADDGEVSQYFAHDGTFSFRLFDHVVIMTQEVQHRWGANLRMVHPTKGTGFDSYDLLGRDIQHWSFFLHTAPPSSQFPDAPRSSAMDGSHIVDLGTPASWRGVPVTLSKGERLFEIPATTLVDGCCPLDEHVMGIRRADELGAFFYVDEPRSFLDGRSLDAFQPSDPLDTSVTMRGWTPMGGIAFAGKRVDLSIKDIQDFEAKREGSANPKGRRFWGPRGNLKVRYASADGRVGPDGDATVTLSESERELGDEADRIDASGRPVDVKTMAFVLVVKDGTPTGHAAAAGRVDAFRRAWLAFMNGAGTGGRGRFDASLHPATH